MFASRLRPTALLAVLAALALLLPNAAAQADDPVLIELGATRERASFVLERFEIAVRGAAAGQGMPFAPEVMEQVYPFLANFLEQRAVELVLIDYARQRGISVPAETVDAVIADVQRTTSDEPEIFAALLQEAGFRDEAQLRELIVETELVQAAYDAIFASVTISEGELRVAYQADRERFVTPAQACVRHILVGELALAEALAAELEAGADFAALAQEHSIDPGSAAAGGELGCIPAGATVPPFDAAAFEADLGELAGPVETQFGYHLLIVDERIAPVQRPFDDVRAGLERELRLDRAELALERAIAVANVRVYPERIPPYRPSGD